MLELLSLLGLVLDCISGVDAIARVILGLIRRS
jgi:hypothetical protein